MSIFKKLFGEKKPTQPAQTPPTSKGTQLRELMLSMNAEEHLVEPLEPGRRVVGVLMDMPMVTEWFSIFSTVLGDASLYSTTNFGVIGGEVHPTVHDAALKFVDAAEEHYDITTPTDDITYPSPGMVRFYFICTDGLRSVEHPFESIMNPSNPALLLFVHAQMVLGELRKMSEARS
ncbi:MAG TPA: hypothetical protein VK171_02650, partial [Fimbriimonas sp.]|nr:hypothetical protein [Fimbriimonas sp.]